VVANSNSEANEYFRELLAWETDGDRTPIQTDPPPAEVMDPYTPALLRRQAA
jgi:hypothetical protein